MTNQIEKQLIELQNMLDTLIETTDHLAILTKAEELEQSVYIFKSLIEGTEAIFKVLPTFEIDVLEPMKKIEQTLIIIAKTFENDAFAEVSEVAETTLKPEFVKMREKFAEVLEGFDE